MSTVRWDVIGVGANSIDHVLILSQSLRSLGVSTKIPLRSQSVRCGGQTVTTLGTCAALGLKTKYVGTVGRDESGRRLREVLSRRGIDTAHLIDRDAATQTATILVHPENGTRIVLSERDACVSLRAEDVPSELLSAARVVHVDDVNVAAAIEAAEAARAAGVPVTSDIDYVS